jgi:hypothetical protein
VWRAGLGLAKTAGMDVVLSAPSASDAAQFIDAVRASRSLDFTGQANRRFAGQRPCRTTCTDFVVAWLGDPRRGPHPDISQPRVAEQLGDGPAGHSTAPSSRIRSSSSRWPRQRPGVGIACRGRVVAVKGPGFVTVAAAGGPWPT